MSQPTSEPLQTAPHNYDEIWQNVYGAIQDYGPTHRHMRRILRQLLDTITYSSVLDVGCGAGHNIPLLTQGQDITRFSGVDISQTALDYAKKEHDGDFHLLDITRETLPGEWELVFSSLLLEHVEDDVTVLKHMHAMSSKYLLVTTIAGDFERYRRWDEQMGHVRNYQVGELEEKCESVGFTVEQAIYWGFPFYTPFARTLQNYMTSKSSNGWTTRIQAEIMYYLYFLNSQQRGDILFLLARANK